MRLTLAASFALVGLLTFAAVPRTAGAQDGTDPNPATSEQPAEPVKAAEPEITHKVLATGEGELVGKGRAASVHYTGRLTDGKKFDSSRDRDDPFTFVVGSGQVIDGWDMTVEKMRVGDRWTVTIPWKFAYGERGRPPTIPAKADLVFDIEVMGVPTAEVEVIANGEGVSLEKGDMAEVHIVGKNVDGVVWHSSREAGQPGGMEVGGRTGILGLDIELPKLRGGDHVKLTLPSTLAFGKKGIPGKVDPNTSVTIDLEILSVVRPTFETITEGQGEPPARGQTAKVHYVGTFKDGKKFDSSRDRNEPFEVPVGRGAVIKGWDWMLARMKPGQRVKVTIPWQMAYGARGGQGIPPKSDLVFDMELLEVVR